MGRKNVIEERGLGQRILDLHMMGKSSREIGAEIGVGYKSVQVYLGRLKEPASKMVPVSSQLVPKMEMIKNQVRLEINQENALSELAKQLQDYTDEYERAPDDKAKYAWSQNRIRILQEMNRVTGLYDAKSCPAKQDTRPHRPPTPRSYTTDELAEIVEFERKHPIS